jgi:hypothetical protein
MKKIKLKTHAANDVAFNSSRCRTLPIISTLTCVPHYPSKLVIFLTNASRYWQVRCFFDGKTIIRSLRTTNKRDALRYAKDFYNANICTAPLQDSVQYSRTHSIERVAKLMLQTEQGRVDRGEVAVHSLTMLVSRLRKHVIPFFEHTAVENIGYAQIERFFNHICAQGYSPITLSQYLTALRKVLNTAHANKWIEQVPQFPKLRISSTARGNFTVAEYLQLLRCAKHMRNAVPVVRKITHRNTRDGVFASYANILHEMAWVIGFMVNSFVRPIDIKLIQHKHVEIVRGEHCYLRLSLPETKRHRAQIVTLPAAVHIYEQLTKYFGTQGLAGADDYLFLPKLQDRQSAIFLLEKQFRRVLETTGLRYGTQGQKRTLYSLRHSAITFRLLYGQGIDLLTLARNARTSLEMIDKFYASELRAEMNVGMLHSRR